VTMSVVSSLAAVVKVTTFLPFLIASLAVVGYEVLRRGRAHESSGWVRQGLLIIACAGLPALALLTWTCTADHAKGQSILGKTITSSSSGRSAWQSWP
jgi:hypothetical protein